MSNQDGDSGIRSVFRTPALDTLSALPFERLKTPALWLVLLVFAATLVFWFAGITATYDPPYLILALNIMFVGIAAFFIAAIGIRSFLRSGSWPVLWLGAGALTLAAAVLAGGWALASVGANAGITIHNSIALLAATLNALGAFFVVNGIAPLARKAGRMSVALQVYVGSLAATVFIIVVGVQGLLPPFFVEGAGGTPPRQIVVVAATLLFFGAGLALLREYTLTKAQFLYWYGLGLLLISLGIAGILMETATGTPLNWMGRVGQLLGGAYLLVAALVTVGEARARNLSPEDMLASFFWRDEANLRRLYESIMDAIIVTDGRFAIKDWNQAAEQVYGWKAEEVLGKPVGDVLHTAYPLEGDRERAVEALRVAGTWRGEVRQKRRDGTEIPILAAVSNLRDATGQVVGAVAVNRDITERKRIEDQLRQSEEQTRDLIRYAPTGIYEVDFRTGRFRSINDAMCEILGYTREELLAMTAFDLLDDAGKFLFGDRMRRTLAGEKVDPSVEYRVIKKDGSAIYSVLNTQITYHDGQPDGAFVIAHDITERRRASEELRLAAETLEHRVRERTAELERANETLRYQASVLENVNDAIVAYNAADLRITAWNRRAEEQYGWTAEEALGGYAPDMVGSKLDPEKRAEIVQMVAKTGRWRGELPHTRRDGTPIIVETSSMALRDESGRVVAHVTANHDITERKRMEEELRASREQLQNLARRLVQLQEDERRAVAYQLHDDIGQELTSLSIGLSILQKRYKGSEAAQVHIETLLNQANQIHASLHDLGADLRPASLDKLGLLPALHQYVDQFEQRYGLVAKLSVVGIPMVRLPSEAQTALYRIVQEALINAARHAQASQVEVLVQRRDGQLIVIVEDNGQGFEVAEAERAGGLGILGMRERAEMLGGDLAIESATGRGTTVCVEVPLPAQYDQTPP